MRRLRTFFAIAMLSTLLVTIDASSTLAAQVHPFVSSFNGSEAGGFFPFGLAVDNSSSASAGDVYVTDVLTPGIKKFDGSGVYLPPTITGISEAGPFSGGFGFRAQNAVNASGDLFVADAGAHVVDEFGPTGEYIPPQVEIPGGGEPVAVAIDSSGRVLIATAKTVYRYDPGTTSLEVFATATSEGEFAEVDGVAVDDDPSSPAFGHVYVTDSGKGAVDVFDSSGTYQPNSQLSGTPSGAFGSVFWFRDVVDPGTGDLYVTAGGVVDEFAPTGAFVSQIPMPEAGNASTIGIAAKTGDLYVADLENARIDVFAQLVTIPEVSNSGTSNLEQTSATVNGQVDPAGGGDVTSCKLEYGTTESYGETAPCSPVTPYVSVTKVSADLGGLTTDTVYHFRFVVHNANNFNSESKDATFETTGPPTIGAESAGALEQTTVRLQAHVNPHGIGTSYHFEYGTTSSYGTSVPIPDADAGAGTIEEEVSAEASGLTLSTTYHYRLVAKNGAGPPVNGPDSEFTTSPAATVESLAALAGPHEVTLRVKVEEFGAPSECEVEYVTEARFASSGYSSPTIAQCTPQRLVGREGEQQAIARLSGLSADTIYHYRYVISNKYGETRSSDQTFITFGLAAFSLESRAFSTEEPNHEGGPYTQAGGHPYILTTNITLNTNVDHLGSIEGPAGTVKDIRVHLPAGLIGNPQAIPQCTRYDSEILDCSGASEIGTIEVKLIGAGSESFTEPLFNIVPPHGVAAEFSARFSKSASAFIVGSVRTGSDYGIDADSLNIATIGPVAGAQVRIWGVPADASHDAERQCPTGHEGYLVGCTVSLPVRPFLRNPTQCTEKPFTVRAQADTYQAPGEFAERGTESPAMTGCERLHFTPTIMVQPESSAADSPTGLHVDLHVPQNENPAGLAEADLKDATVVLPKGLMVNPAGAGGLMGCSEAQIELNGPAPASCPESSKVGTVELTSPLVDHPLRGAVYVAQQGNAGPGQGSNKFKSLIALYVAIDDPLTGVVVKQAGEVVPDRTTGQLTAKFSEVPQLPFEDFKLDFFGGPRAALRTPPACGVYTEGNASFDSWARPGSPVTPGMQASVVSSGPDGSACPSGGFAPGFTAGTESSRAGAFTPFVLSFSRQDGEQGLGGLEATLAPGLLGKLKGVPLCGDDEAAAGACPAASQIGTVTAAAGAGADPVSVQGQVYLSGPYNGGPFGEVVEVPAVAGPFNLGTVVVRGSIRINPSTAQATVVSDPFPTMLQGVPLTLKRVVVTLDRPGFTFNPTNCNQLAVTAKIAGTSGANVPVSVPFQVANCVKLAFEPGFAVSTQARSGKARGASLRVKVTSGAGQANLGKIKVDLPKQLPSRLSTLQKACLAAVFAANPAACPGGSVVGTARAVTPLLRTPFAGPAYLVSHGGAAFPDLEIVLQAEGITLIEDGKTNIKHGITSSTFNSIPDAPISMIELTLPEGPHSALSAFLPPKAKYNMCGQKLLMPSEFTAQNGATLNQNTHIQVTGCPKAKKHKHHKAKKHHKARHGKK